MKCRLTDRDLALYVEGDVAEAHLLEIEKHLSACDRCKAVAEGLRESQSVLKSLRRDHVSAAALAHVRTRVVTEIAAPAKPVWGRWVYAMIGFVVAAAVTFGVWTRFPNPNRIDSLSVVAVAPSPAIDAPETPASSEPPAPRPATTKKARHASPQVDRAAQTDITVAPPKQLVVQLLTDDPNVVIYWLVDDEKTGGSL